METFAIIVGMAIPFAVGAFGGVINTHAKMGMAKRYYDDLKKDERKGR